MSTLYDSLLDTAKSDFEAAKVLAKEHLFAQSLFYLEQAFEKGIKYLFAYYKIHYEQKNDIEVQEELKNIRHDNRQPTFTLVEMLFDLFPESRKKLWELHTGSTVQSVQEAVQRLKMKPLDLQKLTEKYGSYDAYVKTLVIEVKDRWLYTSTDITFKFVVIAGVLALSLVGMESIARYPLKKYDYANVEQLNKATNELTCTYLIDMMYDFLDLAPLVKDTLARNYKSTIR